MDIRQSAIDRTKGFESFTPYLYLDKEGNVTLGYGHMVPSTGNMDDIDMSDGGAAATNPKKEAAWTTVAGKDYPRNASYYENFTTVRIAEPDAATLLGADLGQAAKDLLKRFPALDTYPNDAQDALLDMMFNIGLPKFTKAKWPNFFTAVLGKDWTTAAAESHRDGQPDKRNNAINALFLSAAGSRSHLDAAQVMPAMEQLVQRQMDALKLLGEQTGKPGGLFPNGVTKIHLAVTAGPVNVTLDIVGPPALPSDD